MKLDDEIETLEQKYSQEKQKYQDAQQNIVNIKSRLKELRKKKRLQSKAVDVSDHAVLRYLERVKKINIKEVRQEIIDSLSNKEAPSVLCDAKIPMKNGHKAVVRDKTIVTILSKVKVEG